MTTEEQFHYPCINSLLTLRFSVQCFYSRVIHWVRQALTVSDFGSKALKRGGAVKTQNPVKLFLKTLPGMENM
jgi:hypothetical protein